MADTLSDSVGDPLLVRQALGLVGSRSGLRGA